LDTLGTTGISSPRQSTKVEFVINRKTVKALGRQVGRLGTIEVLPVPNGRCRMHGGLSPGAPKGNRNAFKHGR
jgi:hypothetical protein